MSKLILEQQTYRILGACFEVYQEKGCGAAQVFPFRLFRVFRVFRGCGCL